MEAGNRSGRGRRSSLSQINVTPLVDVMLVLLVIFMVTAPMMDKGLDVNLPQVKQAPDMNRSDEPLEVSVDARGKISVGKEQVANTEKLKYVLTQAATANKERQVLLKADQSVAYGRVAEVMAAIRAAGIEKVGMVMQQEEPAR